MTEISDTMLADLTDYIDRRLDAVQSARIEAELEQSPELRVYLAALVETRAEAPIWHVFDHILDEPVPQRLVEKVWAFGRDGNVAPVVRPAADGWQSALDRVRDFLFPQGRVLGPMLAYSSMLAIGLAAGALATASGAFRNGAPGAAAAPIAADGRLAAVLEKTPSGEPAVSSSNWGIVPIMTFRDKSGGYCRQFAMGEIGVAEGYDGVACRSATGNWHLHAQAAGASVPITPDGKFRPAHGPTRHSPVEKTVDKQISGGDPLSKEVEREVIVKNWKDR